MTALAWALALTLWLIAAVHFYWGLGGLWPARNATSLARAVVGARGITRMPAATACLTVAAVLVAIGSWPLYATAVLPAISPSWFVYAAGTAIAAIFLARGVAPYLVIWRRRTPEQPFVSLDRWLYGPLCLALGTGFAVLLLKGVYK